eukprot:EG_transcript_30566
MDLWFSKQNVSTTSTTSKTTNQSFSQDTASQPSFAPKTTFQWGEERCGPRPPFAFITLSTAAEADSLAQEQSIAVAGQVANIRLMKDNADEEEQAADRTVFLSDLVSGSRAVRKVLSFCKPPP